MHRPLRAAVIETLEVRRLLAATVDPGWGTGGLGVIELNEPGNVVVTELGSLAGGDMLIAGDVDGAGQDSFLIRRDYNGDPVAGFGVNGMARYGFDPFFKVFEQLDGTLLAMPRGVRDDNGPDLVRINATTGAVIAEINVPGGLTGENVDLEPVNVPGYSGSNLFVTKRGAALLKDDGTLDTSFGTGGKILFEAAASGNSYTSFVPNAARIQSNGAVLFAGQLNSLLTSNDFGQIRRYMPQGTLDGSFANAGIWQHPQTGVDMRDITVFSNEFVGNGAILAAGDDGTRTHIARLRSNGSVETNFSRDGREIVAGRLGDMHLSPSGGVVVSTYRTNLNDDFEASARLTRLTVFGTYDVNFFGTNGEARVTGDTLVPFGQLHFRITPSGEHQFAVGAFNRDDGFTADLVTGTVSSRGIVGPLSEQPLWTNHAQVFSAATLDGQDRPIVVGTALWSGVGAAAVRFTGTGQADASFGGDGAAVAPMDGSSHSVSDVTTDAANNLYLVGGSRGRYYADQFNDTSPYIAKLRSDGKPDPSFGGNGTLTVDTPLQNAMFFRTLVLSDGTIAAFGFANDPAGFKAIYGRFTASGTPLIAGGLRTLNLAGEPRIAGVLQTADGGLLLSGSDDFDSSFLAKINLAGDMITSFGTNGVLDPTGPNESQARGLLIPVGNRIFAVGSGDADNGDGDQLLLTRLNPNGSLDTAFGTNGVRAIPFADEDFLFRDAVSYQGGLLVLLERNGSGDDDESVLLKLDAAGNVLETHLTGVDIYARALLVRGDGRIILAASVTSAPGNTDWATVALRLGTPPQLVQSSFDASQQAKLSFTYDSAVGAGGSTLNVLNLTTGATLNPAHFQRSVNGNTVSFVYAPNNVIRPLPSGRYSVNLSGVTDTTGTPTQGSQTLSFAFQVGDLDGDLDVDLFDAARLERNFGRTDNPVYALGDLDYDGDVGLFDAALLERAFGSVLPPLPTLRQPPGQAPRSLFGEGSEPLVANVFIAPVQPLGITRGTRR